MKHKNNSMEKLVTVTFNDGKQKMVVTISGHGTQMKQASIEARRAIKADSPEDEVSLAEGLAVQFLKNLIGE